MEWIGCHDGKKKYITPVSLEYITQCKRHLLSVIHKRGWKVSALCYATSIPPSTMSRWLDEDVRDYMGILEAAVIAEKMNISLSELLPPPIWPEVNPENEIYLTARRLAEIPSSHVDALLEFYWRLRSLVK